MVYKDLIKKAISGRAYRQRPEIKERNRLKMIEKRKDLNYVLKEREHNKKYKKTPEVRDRHNMLRRKRYSEDIEYRTKIISEVKKNQSDYINRPEVKKYHSEYIKEWWKNNPEKKLEYSLKLLSNIGKPFDLKSKDVGIALTIWSRVIRKRDLNICVYCGSNNNLHAHHQYPKSEYPELAFALNNGVTVCIDCHHDIHRGMK